MSFLQRIFLLTRLKLEKEKCSAEPRLFRVLLCANMVDQCIIAGLSIQDNEATQNPVEGVGEHSWRSNIACHKSQAKRSIPAAPSPSGDAESVRPSYPYHTKTPEKFLRPRASVRERAVFRRSIESGREEISDSSVAFDTGSDDFDLTYSDDSDDSDGSGHSSMDNSECQAKRDQYLLRGTRDRLRFS